MSDLIHQGPEAYRLDYFEENGLVRRECVSCGDRFWTRDEDRDTCGEPPCDEYSFIDDPGLAESHTLSEMREAFLSFFEERGHGRVDPYPVAANRWRDDVLLTQASIYDFQPLVTSGQAPPPANPLTVSQPCIRMNDIDNVGRTGRHTMAFEMMAHHAFNAHDGTDLAYDGEVYWKEETVADCDDLLEEMGADLERVTYIEDPWVGGGNAGPAIEVIYEGLELATLVFMSLEIDPDGEYELKDGNRYAPMDTYVVDTGYGLERWTWMSQGTPTVYEAIYPETIAVLKDAAGIDHTDAERELIHDASKLAGALDVDEAGDVATAREGIAAELDVDVDRLRDLVEPLEAIYAIADHCRALAYMFGDGIVPASAGTGYLARMVLRRTKRLADDVGIDAPLDDLVDIQAERLGYENRDTIRDIVRTEVEKYRETLDRGSRRVRSLAEEYAEDDATIPTDRLIELYDSHGLHPETVQEIAGEYGVAVTIPDDFYAQVAARSGTDENTEPAVETGDERVAGLPETERLYYEDRARTEFEAMILETIEREDGYDVVLDQTLFYPEGGGQPADHGTLATDETTVEVRDVRVEDGVILHRTDADPGTGEFVRGTIDAERRRRLMRHHTATHVIGYAARQVLGDHVRQAGAQKGTDSARLDVRHYERLDRETVREIERVANRVVTEDLPVGIDWPDRHDAEAEYGFDLYQGGIPAGERIRVVTVGDDVQACGGTHVARTGELGAIKVLSTERVQVGVERLTFAAGEAAIEATQRTEDALYAAADSFDVAPEAVPETATRFFDEWKDRGKRIEALQEELAEARATGGDDGEHVDLGDHEGVVRRIDADMDELRATANALVEDGVVAVLGGGGGPPDFAQGGGPDGEALDDALAAAPDVLRRLRTA
ncbi:alanine--tRNA ligase [Halobacteriales archaeon SW_7_68_16]|nr:MAG: alanine--tRNA ligase [Halobacteriales archaeon SW_7_68_16]